jgi:hypothetical protein
MHVGISWGMLFLILVFLFSGQEIDLVANFYETIQLDTEFIPKRSTFIAGKGWDKLC